MGLYVSSWIEASSDKLNKKAMRLNVFLNGTVWRQYFVVTEVINEYCHPRVSITVQ